MSGSLRKRLAMPSRSRRSLASTACRTTASGIEGGVTGSARTVPTAASPATPYTMTAKSHRQCLMLSLLSRLRPEHLQQFFHVDRRGHGVLEVLADHGMGKSQRPGMQHRPRDGRVAQRTDLVAAVG